MLVVAFADIGLADRPGVGGKGASLGELTRAGIRVPPGFVVTTEAFEAFLAGIDPRGEIRAAVKGLAKDDLIAISRVTEVIRARIVEAAMAPELERAILAAHDALGAQAVAVRSSATSEDSQEASFAGLQDTFLWIKDGPSALNAVRDCWASLYSVESVSYRLRRNLPEQGLAMGVVVQRMVSSRASGVMFTRSPLTGDRSVIAIEGAWGLGSAVVSGIVTPDKYVVNKVTGEIVKRNVSHKTVEHVPDFSAGGVRELSVPDARRDTACLSDAQLAELAAIGKRVEAHYGCPQDIEWAYAEDGLYLLQSRPETVWANKEKVPAAAQKASAFAHVFDLFGGAGKT